MVLEPRFTANVKHDKTTSFNAIKMGFFDNIENAYQTSPSARRQ